MMEHLFFLIISGIILIQLCQAQVNHTCAEGLKEAFEKVGTSDPKLFKWADYPEEFWPAMELVRHIEIVDQRPKTVKHGDKIMGNGHTLDNELSCSVCDCLADIVINMFENGTDIQVIKDFAINACKAFEIEADPVCEGAVDVYADALYYEWTQIGSNFTTTMFCGAFYNTACFSAQDDAWFNDWTVTPSMDPKPPYFYPLAGGGNVKALLFTDVHVDLTYTPGSNEDCGYPNCCMNTTEMATGNQTGAGYWGTYGHCDIPPWLLEQMFKQVNETMRDFTFAIYPGDSPPHNIWEQTPDTNLAHDEYVINAFRKYFPDKPLYISLGNHEGYPVNGFHTNKSTDPFWNSEWLYGGLGDLTSPFMSQTAVNLFKQNGFYAERPSFLPGLKIINVNNNFGAPMNFFVWDDPSDPADQLAWLIRELQDSENIRERVYIIMHHPPKSTMDGYTREFVKIMMRYEGTIAATFVGHTHSDSSQVYFSDDGFGPTLVNYVNPSFTSGKSKNPEFKIFTVDGGYNGASYLPVHMETYAADISRYTSPDEPPVWSRLYSTRDDYGMYDLGARDWYDVLERAMTDDELFYSLVRHDEQNEDWVNEIPQDRRGYLCGWIKNVETCPL